MTDTTSVDGFANHILSDWDEAMDRFFRGVDYKSRCLDLEPNEIRDSLVRGYGYEVAEAWDEWSA